MIYRMGEDSCYGPYDNFDQTYNIWDGGKMKEDSVKIHAWTL